MAPRVVERHTQSVLHKCFRHEKVFPEGLSSCLLLGQRPSVPGQMAPNLPYPLGHRLGEGRWLQVTQPEPNRVQIPVSSPQQQLAMRERQTAAHSQGRLTVGGGPETPGEPVVCPRDIRAKLVWSSPGSLFPWPWKSWVPMSSAMYQLCDPGQVAYPL